MSTFYAPPDVVAALVAFLRSHGFDAATKVPKVREAGMVRVSRTGGFPRSLVQDEAEILIECWHTDQGASFDLARSIWVLIAAIEEQETIPGLTTHHIEPTSSLLQFPDDLAPDMDRHQLTCRLLVAMDEIEVPKHA